jgi:hypothetical protein
VQCSAVQCNVVQCSAVQCSVVQFSVVQCPCITRSVPCSTILATGTGTVQCSAVQCSAVQCSAVQCSAVHHSGDRPGPQGRFITQIQGRHSHNSHMHCTAQHCTTLNYTAMHCTALHYITLHCTDICTAHVLRVKATLGPYLLQTVCLESRTFHRPGRGLLGPTLSQQCTGHWRWHWHWPQSIPSSGCTALHCSAVQCTALHCTATPWRITDRWSTCSSLLHF